MRSSVPENLRWLILLLAIMYTHAQAFAADLRGRVYDENGLPVGSVELVLRDAADKAFTSYTDEAGRFEFQLLNSGDAHLTLNRNGFFRSTYLLNIQEGQNEANITLNHDVEIQESVEVSSSSNVIAPLETSHQETLVAREIRDLPVPSSHDLKAALPVLPGIVRDNSGQLHIAGSRPGENQFILDGFDISDPVTGDLTTRINVDAVRAAELESDRFGVEHTSAGALTLDTTAGDDRWRAGMTNFIPGASFQQGIHLGNWFPRFTFSGPLEKGRAWFSNATSLQHTFSLVPELPRGQNTATQWSGDNLLRGQFNVTPNNSLQASFLVNRQSASNIGLGPFSPVSTTTDLRAQRYFVSVKDQVRTGSAMYELGFAASTGNSDSLPQGTAPYILTPDSKAGNYFETLHEHSSKWEVTGNAALPSRRLLGTHDCEAGFNVNEIGWQHSAIRNAIEVQRSDGSLLQQATFLGQSQFRLNETQAGVYAQDSWTPVRALIFRFGFRGDWDRILQHMTVAPRLSMNFLPFRSDASKISVGWGIYTQPLRLAVLGPAFDQQRADVFYDQSGNQVTGPLISHFMLPQGGLNQPTFSTASVEWSQRIGRSTSAEIRFTRREGRAGLAYERVPSGEAGSIYLLQNNRQDHYRAFEVSIRHSFTDRIQITGSYTRSRAATNEALDYSLETPVFASQAPGVLAWDVPNRVLVSAEAPSPVWDLLLSCFLEYHSGFPFSVVNQQQQLIGAPNRLRFPDYFSLNLGIEKRIDLFRRVWAIRLAMVNLTGHQNRDSVINNIDSPNFLTFAGGQKRAVTARIRLVGKK
jgi:hypothetical protein